MSGKVLVSANELADMVKIEPVVLIDTRDPAVYAEAHIAEAVNMREVFTYLATSSPEGMKALTKLLPRPWKGRTRVVAKRRLSTSSR